MFDAIAGRYDLLNRVLSAGLDQRWRRRAVNALRLTGRETLLDMCTGTADVALMACGVARRHEPSASISPTRCCELAWRRSGNGQHGRPIALIRGDATRVPLASESVDAATIAFGIRNVQQPDEACRELARVVRRGGRLAILEFGLPRAAPIRQIYLWYFEPGVASHRQACV